MRVPVFIYFEAQALIYVEADSEDEAIDYMLDKYTDSDARKLLPNGCHDLSYDWEVLYDKREGVRE
jgi:hypothetical protein